MPAGERANISAFASRIGARLPRQSMSRADAVSAVTPAALRLAGPPSAFASRPQSKRLILFVA